MRHSRSALTLLELVVVLVILAALGGVVLPLVGVYQDQASESAAVAALSDVSRLLDERYALDGGEYPDRFDSLILLPGKPFSRLASLAEVRVMTLDSNQVNVLGAHGIRYVLDMNPDPNASATFDSTAPTFGPGGPGRWLGPGQPLLQVEERAVLRELGITAGETDRIRNQFILLGFGNGNELVGTMLQEAPFFVPRFGNPNSVYARYLLVFEIPGSGAVGGDVRFRGTLLMTHRGLRGQQALAEEYYRVN